jgi:hypothetical protein
MRPIVFACALLAGSFASLSAANAGVSLPIGIVATFSDGTALTGQFTINDGGYYATGYIGTVAGHALDGTSIPGVEFALIGTSPGTPNVLSANADNYLYDITLTFEHSLQTPGIDPFVLDAGYSQNPQSAECYPYSCAGYQAVDTPSQERLVASGYAYVPEPASAALFGAGLLGLLAARRRQS